MSEKSIPISLPLDKDGFLRRECPSCLRQFKWWHSPADDQGKEPVQPPEGYYCPYCHEHTEPGSWWTEEQLEYAKAMMMAEALQPELRRFKRNVESANDLGSLVHLSVSLPPMARPEPLTEPDDMVRVDLPCHLEEPLKVADDWTGEVACLVCGIRYPVELVKALPDIVEER